MSSDDYFAKVIAILETRPNSPEALRALSEINKALFPLQRTCDNLVLALVDLQSNPTDLAVQARVAAAKLIYSAVIQPLDAALLANFEAEATRHVEASRSGPPHIALITGFQATDFEFELGAGMGGVQGTWHRLWALIVMQMMSSVPLEFEDGISEVLSQLQQAMGRPLAARELQILTDHAAARAKYLQDQN